LVLALALAAVEMEGGSSWVWVIVTPFETMVFVVRIDAAGGSAVVSEPTPGCAAVGTTGGGIVLGGGGSWTEPPWMIMSESTMGVWEVSPPLVMTIVWCPRGRAGVWK
jgi:hypothetical protein